MAAKKIYLGEAADPSTRACDWCEQPGSQGDRDRPTTKEGRHGPVSLSLLEPCTHRRKNGRGDQEPPEGGGMTGRELYEKWLGGYHPLGHGRVAGLKTDWDNLDFDSKDAWESLAAKLSHLEPVEADVMGTGMVLMPTPVKGKAVAFEAASMFTGSNWCARCSRCRETLTKFCFDEEEALSQASGCIDRGECRCGAQLQKDTKDKGARMAEKSTGCTECGMANVSDEYHPHVLCLLVKARGGDTTKAREDLAFVLEAGREPANLWLRSRVDTFLANQAKEQQ